MIDLRRRAVAALNPNSRAAATLRWRARNAGVLRAGVCQCGAQGVVRVYDVWPVIGDEQPFWLRCDAHRDVPLGVPWSGGQPQCGQSRETCTWNSASIATRIIEACGCGTHVGELT